MTLAIALLTILCMMLIAMLAFKTKQIADLDMRISDLWAANWHLERQCSDLKRQLAINQLANDQAKLHTLTERFLSDDVVEYDLGGEG